jgi:hypothetical protein
MAKQARITSSRIYRIEQGTLHDLEAIRGYATTLCATVPSNLDEGDEDTPRTWVGVPDRGAGTGHGDPSGR